MKAINNTEDYDDDEFDRLLDEFIKSAEAEEAESNSSAEEEGTNKEPPMRVIDILAAFSEGDSFGGCYTERTQFRYSSCSTYLHLEIQVYNPYYKIKGYEHDCLVKLEGNGEVLVQTEQFIRIGCDELVGKLYVDMALPFDVDLAFDLDSCYSFYIAVHADEKDIYRKEFMLAETPEHYTDCFSLTSFSLYRVERFHEVDYGNLGKSQHCFSIAGLGSVFMLLGMSNVMAENIKSLADFAPEFEVRLYDETGRLKDMVIKKGAVSGIEEVSHIILSWNMGEDKSNFWQEGAYRVQVLFMDETVVSVPFEVGDRDVESIFGKDAIQPKTNIAGKKIVHSGQVGTPLQRLEEMIGLNRVKKKIKDYYKLVSLEQKRRNAGLPVQPHALHAAFIGNPGTGKTTVARLLGTILKDVGLLSKGHVVYEERSTLLGRYYSSEGEKTLAAMERAKGGILFIDEAYTLYKPEDPKDPGMNVLETLLTALADENNRDWMLLLAGYPVPMKEMLRGNPGLDSRIPESNRYYFDDYNVDELMQMVDLYCSHRGYELTAEARLALCEVVRRAYQMRDESFGNGRYIETLLSEQVVQRMACRLSEIPTPTAAQLVTIEKDDIPCLEIKDYRKPLEKLNQMVGLKELKESITAHLNFVNLVRLRAEQGIATSLPPLHMVFTGNPGTGKTTVADFIGEIYASLGFLSKGNVIRVERSDFMDTRVGGTELKTKAILKNARGNVLFIDEAYTLLGGGNSSADFGMRVIETMLSELSRDTVDLLVILAGYPREMEALLEANPGLRSRFPYVFHFSDYSADELMDIARGVVRKEGFRLSPAASKALEKFIAHEVKQKEGCFGNGRFVTRLIHTKIIPAMSTRIAALPESKRNSKRVLQTICLPDIPASMDGLKDLQNTGFDEPRITSLLAELDAMVGMKQIKKTIHDFVDVARYRNAQKEHYGEDETLLKWSFTGNTGTGKSTVAGIMAELLHAMNLLDKGQLVELKAEEIYNVQDYKVDEILKDAMRRSQDGLLFVDGDAPVFRNPQSHFDSEKLRLRLTSFTSELPGIYALVIAEHESVRQPLLDSFVPGGMMGLDRTLHFEDYTADELLQILEKMLDKHNLTMSEEARLILMEYIHCLCKNRELGYANARTMKLLSQAIADLVLLRESKQSLVSGRVLAQDVKGFVWRNMKRGIGFKSYPSE